MVQIKLRLKMSINVIFNRETEVVIEFVLVTQTIKIRKKDQQEPCLRQAFLLIWTLEAALMIMIY